MSSQPTSPILELQRQQLLLQMEYEEEKKAFEQKTDAIGLQRLMACGDAWWPVSVGRSYYNSLNQLCVEVFRKQKTEDDEEIDHHFEFGRPVRFFVHTGVPDKGVCDTPLRGTPVPHTPVVRRRGVSHTPQSNTPQSNTPQSNTPQSNTPQSNTPQSPVHTMMKGTVSFVDGDRMVVCVPDGTLLADLQQEGMGVQLSFDETSYRMMFDALERTMRAKGRHGYLRDLFYTPSMRPETFSFPDMHFPYLNSTQEHAVNEVLRAKDVAIVHGPPGTGKTTTLVEAIYETLRREPQVLVCAQSNMAVDWIAEKLTDRGLSVLRIGNPSRVDDKMLSSTYERRFEAHPDYPQLWALRKAIRELRAHRKRDDRNWHQKMESLRSRATALEIAINQELFAQANVIAATLVGSGNRLLDGMHFGTLFIDEAAQALEAACWIPLRRAGRVVFAGDHCQLPPTVKCYEALKGGLGVTLMERIAMQKPEAVTLLTMQYRMHEDIMRFSSDWFYHNMVQSAPEVKNRSILDLDIPMTWINTREIVNSEQLIVNSEIVNYSLKNDSEAHLTLLALQAYFEMIGKERILSERIDVGVISPYRAQVQLLRQLLRKQEFFKPFRRFITVNTVDGFQGQERDIIVISMVRSNDEGQIGFLRDLRRMNVAITRTRMKVIILGDKETLTRHPFYRKLWQYIQGLRKR